MLGSLRQPGSEEIIQKGVKRVRRISPGDRPIVAAGGVLGAMTTLLVFYLALGEAGPIILAFSFWGPLLPLRYLGRKFVCLYLNRRPTRMPTDAV
jgi:hypothetical protein